MPALTHGRVINGFNLLPREILYTKKGNVSGCEKEIQCGRPLQYTNMQLGKTCGRVSKSSSTDKFADTVTLGRSFAAKRAISRRVAKINVNKNVNNNVNKQKCNNLNKNLMNLSWQQMVYNINGNLSNDLVSLSYDGTIIAFGSPYSTSGSGHVWVYQYNGSSWVQLGNTINVILYTRFLGQSVSLNSDGTKLAIGGEDGVNVYQYNGTSWVKLGTTINGISNDKFGTSVSLNSDGTKLAIGGPYSISAPGYVKVYQYNGTSWVQLGTTINGISNGDQFGQSVSLSCDGTKVAIGGPYNNSASGYVKVYQYNGTSWKQLGTTIYGDTNDQFGTSVSLSSDGTKLAIGGPYSNSGSGYVKVYEYNSTQWIPETTINGTSNGDYFGQSVSLSSDGKNLAVAAPFSNSNTGYVKVYEYNSTQWIPETTINGTSNGDNFGQSLSLSGDGGKVAGGRKNYVSIYKLQKQK